MQHFQHFCKLHFLVGLFFIGMVLISQTATASSDPVHHIPAAPADYLAKTNPLAVENVKPLVLKRTKRLYKNKCRKCHGVEGDGQGPNAEFLTIKPAQFSTPGYLTSRKDGQLFWIIEHGSPDTDMPAHGQGSRLNLTTEEIWQLVLFLRSQFTR